MGGNGKDFKYVVRYGWRVYICTWGFCWQGGKLKIFWGRLGRGKGYVLLLVKSGGFWIFFFFKNMSLLRALRWSIRSFNFFRYFFPPTLSNRGFLRLYLLLLQLRGEGGERKEKEKNGVNWQSYKCVRLDHHQHSPPPPPSPPAAGVTQSQLLPISSASLVSHSTSTWSNPFSTLQSTSMTPTTTKAFFACLSCPSGPIRKIGITISLRLSASQAICPGKACVSGIKRGRLDENAVPQTPWPGWIIWHAGFPWKGARMRLWGGVGERV